VKTLTDFLKVTLIGGLLVVLPLWLSVLLLFKAIKSALALLKPIAKLVPEKFVHHDIVALCLLILICFGVGLLIRTRMGQLIGDWLEQHLLGKIPGFLLIRGMVRQFAGKKDEQSFEPALVEIEEALVRLSSSRNMPTDNSLYSSHPVLRPWPVPSIFFSRNGCILWTCRCARPWSA